MRRPHLYEVAQLRGNDKNVRGERHLTEALKLLVVHVDLLHRWVQWVVTSCQHRNTGCVNVGQPQKHREHTSSLRSPTSSASGCVSVSVKICLIQYHCNTNQWRVYKKTTQQWHPQTHFVNAMQLQLQIHKVLMPEDTRELFVPFSFIFWLNTTAGWGVCGDYKLKSSARGLPHQLISSAPMWNKMSVDVKPKVTPSISRVQGSGTRVTRCETPGENIVLRRFTTFSLDVEY